MADNFQFGIKLRYDGKEVAMGAPESVAQIDAIGEATTQASAKGRAAFNQLGAASHSFAEGASADVQKILDRYDPMGAKLAQLKADFDRLNQSAMAGAVSPKDDARVDLAYRKITDEIKALETAGAAAAPVVAKVGTEMAAAAEKGIFSTVRARQEMIVLGHEALQGNFSRMPGSFMVLAEAAGSAGHGLLATVAPIAAVAAGLVVLAKAAADGHAELVGMNNAMALTANFSGTTRSEMRALAQAVAEAGTATVGETKAMVTELVSSGKIGAEALAPISRLADNFAAAMGKDMAEVGPALVKLFSDPSKGAEELNQRLHFLTVTEQEHIRELQLMGQATEAQLFLAEKLNAVLPEQAAQLGDLQRAWLWVRNTASSAWDAMMGQGRAKTTLELLKEVEDDLYRGNTDQYGGQDAAENSKRTLQQKYIQESVKAAAEKAAAKQNVGQHEIADILRRTREYQADTLRAQLERLQKGESSGDTELDAKRPAAIRDLQTKIANLEHPLTVKGAKAEANADLRKEIAAQDGVFALAKTQYKEYLADLDLLRKQGLISEKEAVDAKAGVQAAQLVHEEQQQKAHLASYLAYNKRAEAERAAARIAQIAEEKAANEAARQRAQSQLAFDQRKGLANYMQGLAQPLEDQSFQASLIGKTALEQEKLTYDRQVDLALHKQLFEAYLDENWVLQERAKDLGDLAPGYIAAAEAAKKLHDQQLNEAEARKSDWTIGAAKGLDDYLKKATDVASQSAAAMTHAFSSMEDALVSFCTTGKLDFKSLAQSIIADLVRMQVQASITTPLATMMKSAGGLSGIFSSVSNWFASANGNVFDAPGGLHQYVNTVQDRPTFFGFSAVRPFAQGGVFAEAGPEAVMPLARDASGRLGVQAHGAGGGGLVYSPSITIDARGADAGMETRIYGMLAKFAAQQKDQVLGIVKDAYARKGRQAGF